MEVSGSEEWWEGRCAGPPAMERGGSWASGAPSGFLVSDAKKRNLIAGEK